MHDTWIDEHTGDELTARPAFEAELRAELARELGHPARPAERRTLWRAIGWATAAALAVVVTTVVVTGNDGDPKVTPGGTATITTPAPPATSAPPATETTQMAVTTPATPAAQPDSGGEPQIDWAAGTVLDLPLGFLASGEGRLAHGQLWRRVTFEKRVSFLVVTRHPQSKEAGRSVVEATRLVESQLATARALVRRGPRVAAATVGGQPGVLAEVEARMGGAAAGGRGDGHPTYAATFFLPWSDHTLEVTVFGEADDAPRLRATLERVVASAQAAGKPAMVPDTTRIAGEVTPAGRRRVYRLLCHLATRNREVGAKEREVLEQERVSLLVTREEADALEAEGREGKKLDLSKAAPEQRLLLDAMIDLVAADGVLEHEEQRRLLEIAVAAGIPRATVTERLLERLSSGGRP